MLLPKTLRGIPYDVIYHQRDPMACAFVRLAPPLSALTARAIRMDGQAGTQDKTGMVRRRLAIPPHLAEQRLTVANRDGETKAKAEDYAIGHRTKTSAPA
jgi:hypothetical protein